MNSQDSQPPIFDSVARCDPIAVGLVSLPPKISHSQIDNAKLSGLEEEQFARDSLYLLQVLARTRPDRSKRFETPDGQSNLLPSHPQARF
jgi:hypothetical protein